MKGFNLVNKTTRLFPPSKWNGTLKSYIYKYNIRRVSTSFENEFNEMKSKFDKNDDSIPTAYTEYFQNQEVSIRGALNLVLRNEVIRDDNVILLGEEVAQYNGAYKISKGMWKEFGDSRIIDTPITEMGFTGVGIGAALNGLIPIVEFMSFNFAMQAIDQIVNSASKLLYMSGGTINVPVTFRGCNGAAKAVGAQHSQDFTSWYSSVPGLKVFSVYDHIDAVDCLGFSIRDPDPCVVLENEIMYGAKFKIDKDFLNVNNRDFSNVLGKARVMKEGKDITIGCHGRMVQFVLEAVEELEKEGVSCEVINFRNLRPFDRNALVNSVTKTHRCMYVEEGWPQSGIGSEVCAILMESSAFDQLDAPVERVCAIDVPMPYCPNLEEMVLPSPQTILKAARKVLS